jgi:FkbM family methyltransferase
MIFDAQTGIAHRENTFDAWIVNESRNYFPLGLREDDIVLDLGGHIGAFAARAMLEQPKIALSSVEAETSNFEVLKQNAEKFQFDAVNRAIVDDDLHEKDVTLYINEKKNNATHTLLQTRGRSSQTVQGIGWSVAMEIMQPTVIKCDIEGGEFLLPWAKLREATQVRLVVIELHLVKRGHRDKAKELVELFRTLNFTCAREPRIGEKNWTTLAIWTRGA